MNELADARLIKLPKHMDANGDGVLVVAEVSDVPFEIQRMFTIAAPGGATRGRHAHRLCSQLMLCVTGGLDVTCDNANGRKTFSLDSPEKALLVPSGLWVEIRFKQNESVLIVLCDRVYEEGDYIRDYAEFLAFRKAARG
jgi:dTDP-4-dehydrorhamnose 3,5-epimerase-like enzyme